MQVTTKYDIPPKTWQVESTPPGLTSRYIVMVDAGSKQQAAHLLSRLGHTVDVHSIRKVTFSGIAARHNETRGA